MQINRTHNLEQEQARADALAFGHSNRAVQLRHWGWRIAVPAAVLSAIVGTTVFATLEKDVNFWVRLAVGLVSLSAAVLSTLQSVLRFAERAEQHRAISAEYRSVVREIRMFLADYDASDRQMTEEKAGATIDLIRKRLDDLDQRAPELPEEKKISDSPPSSQSSRGR